MGWRDVSEEEILKANIDKYNDEKIVNFYKDFKEPRYSYIEYEVIFNAVLEAMGAGAGQGLSAVDMCGGAGKAAFVIKKLAPRADVTLVDLSDKMLDIARLRMNEEKLGEIEIVEADAFSFLEEDRQFDIIVFSSAIHHFKDPVSLLQKAAERLSKRGVIITIADPTTLTKSRRYKTFEFMLSNRENKKKVLRKALSIKNIATSEIASSDDEFDVAEYQTYTGIDDMKLRKDLAEENLHAVLHIRYPAGDPKMVKLMSLIKLHWAFSMVLAKESGNNKEITQKLSNSVAKDLPFKFSIM